MSRLTMREVIEHCNRHTEAVERHSSRMQLEETPIGNSNFMKQYWEHRQVAEWLEELQSYKDKEEQGLLKTFPCGIGADVYIIPSETNFRLNLLHGHGELNRVYHQKVDRITFHENGWYMETDKEREYGTCRLFLDRFYKETWFLTKAEAEEALAKMGGK